jgi:hypothetical protein
MPDPYTVIHGGFHKTGATFLQKMLGQNQAVLSKHGIYTADHRDMRKHFTAPCQQHRGSETSKPQNQKRLRKRTQRFFEPIVAAAPDRLIMTDQNLAGGSHHCVRTGELYRHCDAYMNVVASEIPFNVDEIHLGLRNYADYFAATYVDYISALRPNSSNFVSPRAMCDLVFKRLSGWDDVVSSFCANVPSAKITLWRFEDFAAQPTMQAQVIQNLLGGKFDIAKLKTDKAPLPVLETSARAMTEVQLVIESDGLQAGAKQLRALQKAYPCTTQSDAFDPWEHWERAHLTRLYDQDMDKLRGMPGFKVL